MRGGVHKKIDEGCVEWNVPRHECRGRCPHRPAQGWFVSKTRLNREMLFIIPFSPSHSTYRVGSVRFRDDVGIVPYKQTGGAWRSTSRVRIFTCRRPSLVTPLRGAPAIESRYDCHWQSYLERFAALCNTPGGSQERSAEFNRPAANAGHTP